MSYKTKHVTFTGMVPFEALVCDLCAIEVQPPPTYAFGLVSVNTRGPDIHRLSSTLKWQDGWTAYGLTEPQGDHITQLTQHACPECTAKLKSTFAPKPTTPPKSKLPNGFDLGKYMNGGE